MPLTTLPITNGFYRNNSLPASAQECVNWYVSPSQRPGLSGAYLFGTPGIKEILTTGLIESQNRGQTTFGGVPYFVNGEALYRLNRSVVDNVETFDAEIIGTVEGTARCTFASNDTQLVVMVSDSGKGYIYDTVGPTFAEITDPDFRANGDPQQVAFLDSYFVFITDTGKFIVSAINDGTSYSALDFGSAEASPDGLTAILTFRNQLFLCGETTIEVFQSSTSPPAVGSPFVRIQGFVIPYGVSAPFSPVVTGDSFMFIGGSVNEQPSIRIFDGSTTQKVSTDAVDLLLEGMSDRSVGFYYSEAGARFAGFSLQDTTIVYDFTSQQWHERRSVIQTEDGVQTIAWRASGLVDAYDRIIVADSQDGRVGELDRDVFDEYGTEIRRTVVTQPFVGLETVGNGPYGAPIGNAFFVPRIELTVESGVGDAETPDPKMSLDISRDGKTYADKRVRSLGRVGEFGRRVIWRKNGRYGRLSVMRFTLSDRVKPVILKLEADIVPGTP